MCTRVGFRSPSQSVTASSHTATCTGTGRPEGFLRVFPASCTCVSRRLKEERLCGQQNHRCSRQAVGGSFLCRPTGEEFQEGHSLLQEPKGLEGRRPRSPRVTRCLSVTQPFGASSVSGVGELHGSLVSVQAARTFCHLHILIWGPGVGLEGCSLTAPGGCRGAQPGTGHVGFSSQGAGSRLGFH